MPRFARFALIAALSLPATGLAAPEIDGEDYRLFCGYLDALENPKISRIKSNKRRDRAIAKMARMSPKKLMAAVRRVEPVGATCEEVGKLLAESARVALEKELGKARIAFFNLDYSDPSHVVAQVTWRIGDRKKILQDASLIAKVLTDEAVITKTIALRGVNASAKDWSADEAMLWEAKTNPMRAKRIDKARIADYAESRYKRLFDGIVDKSAL